MNSSPLARTLLASVAIAAAITLGGCDTDSIAPNGRAQAPLSDKVLAELEQKQMDKDSPILVRMFKEEAEAEIWKKNRSGEYALLKTYPICRWSGSLGPKVKEGDRQAPEGFYSITPGLMNPNSNYYLAFNMGYPNAFDRSWNRTGSELMVHGDCSSRGCYAMTDEQMVEIYALAREAFFGGQKSFQVQAYPFRMTAENMAKHRNSPHLAFWKMLKTGNDHFEVTHAEPKVDVCERRYVFNAGKPENASRAPVFNSRAKCPAYEVPQEVAQAVADKQQRDNEEYAALVSRGISVVAERKGVDGGMHPTFYAKLNPASSSEIDDRTKMPIIPPAQTPGALPRSSNNPPAPTVLPAAPQQFELASASSAPAISGDVPVPGAAPLPKEGVAPEPKPRGIAGLIDSLFSSPATEAAAAAPAAAPAPARTTRTAAAKQRPARASRVASTTAKPDPKPAPAARTASAAPPPQLKPAVSDQPAASQAPAPEPRRETRSAFAEPPAPRSGQLAGAQPIVPSGTFESRWSGLR